MMTIDEVIAHEREGADIARGNIIKCNNIGGYESWHNSECIKRAEEHEQIAEWLEELKAYKERKCNKSVYLANKSIDMIDAVNKGHADGYNKAIDDFAKWLENKKYLMKEINDHYLCYAHYDEMQANDVIREYLAEQLKEGVNINE